MADDFNKTPEDVKAEKEQVANQKAYEASLTTVEVKNPENTRDNMNIANLEMQKSNLQSMVASLTKEHLEYQKKKDEKLEQLKATRSQRLRQTEMAGKNIWEMIKELDRPEMRRKYGKYMQKMKIASDTIGRDWSNSLEYEDGQWDQPLLSPDSETEVNNVEKLPENTEKEIIGKK